jgi:hypothetical protein
MITCSSLGLCEAQVRREESQFDDVEISFGSFISARADIDCTRLLNECEFQ